MIAMIKRKKGGAMKKILFILIIVAAACTLQIIGFQTVANAAWGEDALVTNYIPDSNSIKPSMAAAPNGDLYIAVEDVESTEIRLYKSTDGGETWAYLFWIGFNLLNPSLAYAAGAEKWVFITFEVLSTVNSRYIELFRFDPDNPTNSSWTNVASGIYMPNGVHIQPEICTDALYWPDATYVYVTYSIEGLTYYPAYFTRSTDYGLTWSEPMEVTGYVGMSSGWQTQPDIAYGPSGLYITFEKMGWNGSSWTNQIWVTKSTDWGATWNTPIQVTSSSVDCYHPRIAVASNGTVMVAYTIDHTGGYLDIFSHYSTDGGTTWNFKALTSAFGAQEEVELSVSTNNGRFHAAYYRDEDIWYAWADATNPGLGWSNPAIIVNELNAASHYDLRPAVCPNPSLPVDQEACVAWTDYRNTIYDIYFDHVSVCGDGWLSSDEQCDDGNTLNGDCCSTTCTLEPPGSPCPDALFCDGYETCDGLGGCQLSAGNPCLAFPGTVCNETTDTCDPAQVCGNGTVEGSEQCDDGNTVNADCCSAQCVFESNGSPCGNQDTTACTEPDSCTGDGYCSPGNQPAGTQCTTDGNMCTDDECDGLGVCIHINNTDPCDDYLFCTGADTCNGGTCSVHSGDPCFPLLCDEITNTCGGSDFDGDGVPDSLDNCTYQYNPGQEDLDSDAMGDACDNCPHPYNHYQEDTYPPQTNGCGDACECEGNFDGDPDQDGTDAFVFKQDFGRSRILNPCTSADPCNGDFTCDYDVDGTDAFTFKSDFGRSTILNPCPYCVTIPWCVY
jgi:cysteine-rich repeat protein